MTDVVICGAKRTPMGGFQGELSSLAAPDLGATAIRGALDEAGADGAAIDETLMGIVLPAGVGQAPARQASLGAGLPLSTPATAISKVCGSGMQAVIQGATQILAGHASLVVAGGMESMSNAPYLSPATRAGARLGHARMLDHMFLDGLEDAYEGGLMGSFAETCAGAYDFSRAAQDAYAIASLDRARAATEAGILAAEIAPVTVTTRKGAATIATDEQPRNARQYAGNLVALTRMPGANGLSWGQALATITSIPAAAIFSSTLSTCSGPTSSRWYSISEMSS